MISARVICDSIAQNEKRLTTFVLEYPRFIHSEVMTHRILSKNAASSRAIPVKKFMERIQHNPAMPLYWGRNQKGMQAKAELSHMEQEQARDTILEMRDMSLIRVHRLEEIGLHKQSSNRYLEPWMHMTTVMTGTEWTNFYSLRAHPEAQPEFMLLAEAMLEAHNESEPEILYPGEWHLPFVQPEELPLFPNHKLLKFSTARCARVSYTTHEGVPNHDRDIERHDELYQSGHVSPFEHQATPLKVATDHSGNFSGWMQYRKTLTNEYRSEFPRLLPKKGVRRRAA